MGAKILIVEDDPDVMRILTHALTTVGHRVIPAYGGEDAIRKAKAQPFDLQWLSEHKYFLNFDLFYWV